MTENKRFTMSDVSVLSSKKYNAVAPPKPLTGITSVNRSDDDTISISVPSTGSQKSNRNEIDMVEVVKKSR